MCLYCSSQMKLFPFFVDNFLNFYAKKKPREIKQNDNAFKMSIITKTYRLVGENMDTTCIKEIERSKQVVETIINSTTILYAVEFKS